MLHLSVWRTLALQSLPLHSPRCIDKAGGLDAYILNTPDHKMGSDVGTALREQMRAARLVPPPLPESAGGPSAAGAGAAPAALARGQAGWQPAAADPG